LAATGAWANIPDPNLSDVPDGLTVSPGTLHGNIGTYSVQIQGPLGPVTGAAVIVEVAPDAAALVAWCVGQVQPIQMAATNGAGVASFTWKGGGCMDPDGPYLFNTYIVQVRADNVVMAEPYISSPDVVNTQGRRATEIEMPVYEMQPDSTWSTEAGLADAVEHTAPIQLGLTERCSKLSPDPITGSFLAPVGLSDAVELTPYIQEGTFCHCQYP
jgi:hypothetical protein